MIKKSKLSKAIKRLPLEVRAEMALKEAVADAVAKHKRLGYPIAVWKDGRSVWIKPEEIVVPKID